MSHKAQAIVLTCIDFRFREAVSKFIEQLGIKDFDLKTDAGGVKQIVEKTPVGDWILKNFEIAFDLHDVIRIILISHEDCGAYGGSSAFESKEKEVHFQSEQLKQAAEILKQKYPGKQIEAYLARLTNPISFDGIV